VAVSEAIRLIDSPVERISFGQPDLTLAAWSG
jgi:hypothetical protein